MEPTVTREICQLASIPLQSPLYKAVAAQIYDYDGIVLNNKIFIRDYPYRVLNCKTPDSIDQRDKKFKELCDESVRIAKELFGKSKTFAVSNINTAQIRSVIIEMQNQKLLL